MPYRNGVSKLLQGNVDEVSRPPEKQTIIFVTLATKHVLWIVIRMVLMNTNNTTKKLSWIIVTSYSCIQDKDFCKLHWYSKSYLTHMGKVKIENFSLFDTDWFCGTLWYAIVKVEVTGSNDITKCHGIVITIWQKSAMEVSALSKTHFLKWKVCKKKNLSWVWGTDRNTHSLTSLGKPHDARQ